jgi:DNA-binding phage protein
LFFKITQNFTDGDFNKFFKSLEKVIKSRDNISSFAKKIDIDRTNLYSLFNGEKVPRIDTLAKILKALGYSLEIKEIPEENHDTKGQIA